MMPAMSIATYWGAIRCFIIQKKGFGQEEYSIRQACSILRVVFAAIPAGNNEKE